MNKFRTSVAIQVVLAVQLCVGPKVSFARDLHVPIPQRTPSTPSQRLNREGVAELKHGHQEKAKRLFYKAYLLDPEDPFTLNNLGYIAELEGDADRALRYYALAARDHTDAIIDRSNVAALQGKPLDDAFQQVKDSDQEVSRLNERAIVMLEHGQVFEARNLLRSALPSHPRDPFLLNNLGYALEAIGDNQGALRCYSQAASMHSMQRVIVTPRAKMRGKPISEVAAANAAAVSEQIARGEGPEAATARLNLRGVAALNDNNPAAAREFFLQAYKVDPSNAFTLNNLGYISELDGDEESAQSYYQAAETGRDAKAKVTYATRRDAEGEKITTVADDNQGEVQSTLKAMQQEKRRANQPIELKRRDTTPVNSEQNSAPVPATSMAAPALPNLPPPDGGDDNRPPSTAQPNSQPPVSEPQSLPQ